MTALVIGLYSAAGLMGCKLRLVRCHPSRVRGPQATNVRRDEPIEYRQIEVAFRISSHAIRYSRFSNLDKEPVVRQDLGGIRLLEVAFPLPNLALLATTEVEVTGSEDHRVRHQEVDGQRDIRQCASSRIKGEQLSFDRRLAFQA